MSNRSKQVNGGQTATLPACSGKRGLPHNIEKSGFRRGEYIGYCNGAQRIRRSGSGWATYALGSSSGVFVYAYADTLRELGAKLAERRAS